MALALLPGVLGGCGSLLQSNAPEHRYCARRRCRRRDGERHLAWPSLRVGHCWPTRSRHCTSCCCRTTTDEFTPARWPAAMPIRRSLVQTLRACNCLGRGSGEPVSADYRCRSPCGADADHTAPGRGAAVQVVPDCSIGRREGREVVSSFVVAGSVIGAANRLGEASRP
jgi:hypothetical protein